MDECPECSELDKRITQRVAAMDEATHLFSGAVQANEPEDTCQQLAASAYEAEIELRVLYEIQVIHRLLHSDPASLKDSN
jgi:hypothetical protein